MGTTKVNSVYEADLSFESDLLLRGHFLIHVAFIAKYQGFGKAKNATTPFTISTLPFSDDVACGSYHTCVITSK